jgi:hypothetical protein
MGKLPAPVSSSEGHRYVPNERHPDRSSAERQRRLADACAKASASIDAARAASDRASLVLRATDQVLTRVARALERRARG